jgi:hypothetical protein
VHPNYEDFSTPCFDGLHHVIQGGSFISTGNECSVHSRFHFRPHFYQHASFRVVEMESPNDVVLTSDTDAPGPYVGSYPFRRSAKSAQEETARVLSDNLQRQRNDLLLKHFASRYAACNAHNYCHFFIYPPRSVYKRSLKPTFH